MVAIFNYTIYKVMSAKPVFSKLVFDIDLLNDANYKDYFSLFELITKKSISKNL